MWWHTRRDQISSFGETERVHLNRPGGRQFSRLLAAEVCASAVVMMDTPCSEVVWRVLATHSMRQFAPSLLLLCVTVWHHISTGLYFWVLKFKIAANARTGISVTCLMLSACLKPKHLQLWNSPSRPCYYWYHLCSYIPLLLLLLLLLWLLGCCNISLFSNYLVICIQF